MYLIVGLGNPGREYHGTRHNAGFAALDRLIEKYHFDGPASKFKALLGRGMIGGNKVIAAKPLTFMNLSGESVRQITDYYGIDPETELVVISDDVDLPVGRIRIRKSGSAGGHNGLKNIIAHEGTQNFTRIRIGVGAAERGEMIGHVLGHFTKEDAAVMEEMYENAADAAAMIIEDGVEAAMNRYNTHGV